jgi:hypothetical protein
MTAFVVSFMLCHAGDCSQHSLTAYAPTLYCEQGLWQLDVIRHHAVAASIAQSLPFSVEDVKCRREA